MTTRSYDDIAENALILLDLPFREGAGILTKDHAKPHHPITLNDPGGGSFVWTTLASGIMVLEFVTVGGGAADGVYLNSLAADTIDLDFTLGDFSIGCWINWAWNGNSSIIIGRYGVNLDGWEIYLDESGGRNTVSQRHNHNSLAPNTNSNCYSCGWTPGIWMLLGISRIGGNLYPQHYRNGNFIAMHYAASGMLDPDTCNRDLVIGTRYTKNTNWYKGQMWRPRVWDRALSASEWKKIFESERSWLGI